MTPRLNPYEAAPRHVQAFLAMSAAAEKGTIEPALLELVKMRSSQINGCANCLNMHSAQARKAGETEQRLYLLNAWEEAPCYSDRERAALAWTDHLTEIAGKRAPEAVYAALAEQFTPEEQVQLTMMINVINGWNRLAVGFNLFDPSLAA
ncbi:carboxymuconolactone decarboxylase family protein [Hephaestia mangrovi]|jgi:AhpD family alkylhydroperoxidase|uniref:carboxymuconolactone decarboxylase family protein n=1 Tax=Hephaestia mangrovi TaxID=2873268 RepID=UPI001CA77C3D|nr:carboxymuconolactone decarboxylase family protein [Hephaestia mangrovi]MBY8827161.1 carboxymuconolactone decarboxylase family protein [Hephaestia mangrovi]